MRKGLLAMSLCGGFVALSGCDGADNDPTDPSSIEQILPQILP
jgi:hypothetical protein